MFHMSKNQTPHEKCPGAVNKGHLKLEDEIFFSSQGVPIVVTSSKHPIKTAPNIETSHGEAQRPYSL